MAGVPRWYTLNVANMPVGAATIDWGDSTADATRTGTGSGTSHENHEYTVADAPDGTTITLTVTAADGQVSTVHQKVVSTAYPDIVIAPSGAAAGSGPVTIAVTTAATTFTATDVVWFAGTALVTRLVSGTELSADIPASLLKEGISADVYVVGTQGNVSPSKTFTVSASRTGSAGRASAAGKTGKADGPAPAARSGEAERERKPRHK